MMIFIRSAGLSMSTENGYRPFPFYRSNKFKDVFMNWLTLQMIPFITGQIGTATRMSGSTLIVPDGRTIEAATFGIHTNSGNVSWYPLKSDVNLGVNRSLSKIAFIFRRFLSTIGTSCAMINSLIICLHMP